MVHSPTSTASSDPRCAGLARDTQVHLFPGILVAADDYAGIISVQQQKRVLVGLVSVEPVVCQRDIASGCGFVAYQSSNVRLK